MKEKIPTEIVKVCKKHGELTIRSVYMRKDGGYRCRACKRGYDGGNKTVDYLSNLHSKET